MLFDLHRTNKLVLVLVVVVVLLASQTDWLTKVYRNLVEGSQLLFCGMKARDGGLSLHVSS